MYHTKSPERRYYLFGHWNDVTRIFPANTKYALVTRPQEHGDLMADEN